VEKHAKARAIVQFTMLDCVMQLLQSITHGREIYCLKPFEEPLTRNEFNRVRYGLLMA